MSGAGFNRRSLFKAMAGAAGLVVLNGPSVGEVAAEVERRWWALGAVPGRVGYVDCWLLADRPVERLSYVTWEGVRYTSSHDMVMRHTLGSQDIVSNYLAERMHVEQVNYRYWMVSEYEGKLWRNDAGHGMVADAPGRYDRSFTLPAELRWPRDV